MRNIFIVIVVISNILILNCQSTDIDCSEKIVLEGFDKFTDMSYRTEIVDMIEENEIEEILNNHTEWKKKCIEW